MQTELLLCWSGVTDTEHSTTSCSNEEEGIFILEAFRLTLIGRKRQYEGKHASSGDL